MRWFVVFLLLAASTTAQAQYPWGYAPYPPPYPYTVRPYVQPPSQQPMAEQVPIERAMLEAHNALRAKVGVPPLVWSPPLAAVAREWANYLVSTGGFSHRQGNRYGENLYAMSGASVSPLQVVQAWANEAYGYDPRGNVCNGVCGHYTQIVWRSTRSVGCAVAAGPRREVWVCDYDPPGNYVGQRPY